MGVRFSPLAASAGATDRHGAARRAVDLVARVMSTTTEQRRVGPQLYRLAGGSGDTWLSDRQFGAQRADTVVVSHQFGRGQTHHPGRRAVPVCGEGFSIVAVVPADVFREGDEADEAAELIAAEGRVRIEISAQGMGQMLLDDSAPGLFRGEERP